MAKHFLSCKITFSILATLSVFALIFFAFILQILVNNQIKDGAVLDESTEELWGEIPGKTKAIVYRDNYLFNIDNTDDFMTKLTLGQKTQINQSQKYRIQEKSSWINRVYNNKDEVEFNLYKHLNDISEEEKAKQNDIITTLNIPAIAVWTSAKNIPDESLALTAVYSVYKGLETDFYYQYIHQSLMTELSTEVKFKENIKLYSVSAESLSLLYNDKKYGFSCGNGYFTQAVLCNYCDDYYFFINYFQISSFEVNVIRTMINIKFPQAVSISRSFLGKDYSKENVAAYQWLKMKVNDGEDTIYKSTNTTVPGYVEYGAYLFYMKDKKNSTLPIEKAKSLLILNDFGSKGDLDDSKSLFNKRIIDIVMNSKITREESINHIITLLDLEDYKTEAEYLHDYLTYLVKEVALLESIKGYKAIAALATFINQAFYPIISKIGYILLDNLFTNQLYSDLLLLPKPTCVDILKDNNTPEVVFDAEQICNKFNLLDKKVILKNWIKVIFDLNVNNKNDELLAILNGNNIIYENLFGRDSKLYSLFKASLDKIVANQKFKLNENKIAYSYYTLDTLPLAIMQFASGSITKTEFNLDSVYDILDSDGNRQFNSKPEYYSYCVKNGLDVNKFTEDDFKKEFNFDNLFAAISVQKLLITYFTKPTSNLSMINSKFNDKDFINYLQYIMLNEALGGLFLSRKASDFLWGFESKILQDIKGSNYYIGGDPTIDTKFTFLGNMDTPPTDKNIKWAAQTGKQDINRVRTFTKAFGTTGFIKQNALYFDGKSIKPIYKDPWKIPTALEGTDAMSFKPLITEKDKPTAFIDDLYRVASFNYYNTKEYNGFKVKRFTLNNKLVLSSKYNKENSAFYMEKYNGFGNQTSVLQAPLFASMPNYKYCNDSTKSEIINNEKHGVSDDEDDSILFNESFLDVEPYSGAVVRAAQKILVSLLIEKDELFDIKEDVFVPVNYVFRTGNLTKEGLEFLDDLSFALNLKFYSIIITACLSVIFIGLLIFFCIKKPSNEDEVEDNLIKFYSKEGESTNSDLINNNNKA